MERIPVLNAFGKRMGRETAVRKASTTSGFRQTSSNVVWIASIKNSRSVTKSVPVLHVWFGAYLG